MDIKTDRHIYWHTWTDKQNDWLIDLQREIQTDSLSDGLTGKHEDRKANRYADIQADRKTNRFTD